MKVYRTVPPLFAGWNFCFDGILAWQWWLVFSVDIKVLTSNFWHLAFVALTLAEFGKCRVWVKIGILILILAISAVRPKHSWPAQDSRVLSKMWQWLGYAARPLLKRSVWVWKTTASKSSASLWNNSLWLMQSTLSYHPSTISPRVFWEVDDLAARTSSQTADIPSTHIVSIRSFFVFDRTFSTPVQFTSWV